MIYVYAITDRPQTATVPEAGIEGSCLFPVAYRDIATVVSLLNRVEVPPTAENVWRHEEIVEQLMAMGAVLPVRFGTVLTDEAAVRAMLAARYSHFVANLDRVRGRVELGLRVLGENEDHPTQQDAAARTKSSGRAYLFARAEEERRARARYERGEALAAELDGVLAGLAVETSHQVQASSRLLLTAAYLVERVGVGPFLRKVQALGSTYPGMHVVCTGPWPPYSFVGTGLSGVEKRERWDAT